MENKLKVLDLFAGIGGFSLGLERTGGFETVAFCEIEPFAQTVLRKHWPEVPIFEDVRELKGEDVGTVDVITGGFPCQDLSIAGKKKGITADRSGLWSEIIRLACELRPKYIFVENVTNLLSGPDEQPGQWFGKVLGDLAQIGYDAQWNCVPASAIGAPHQRDRVWIIAYPKREGLQGFIEIDRFLGSAETAFPIANHATLDEWSQLVGSFAEIRSGDGLPVKLERGRIKACGNAIVPTIAQVHGYAILNDAGFNIETTVQI